jgi:hypothetical protein
MMRERMHQCRQCKKRGEIFGIFATKEHKDHNGKAFRKVGRDAGAWFLALLRVDNGFTLLRQTEMVCF